ncbi:MAG: peptide deformylase [Arenicellales bacterium]|nr:peptide deformylase [Arenicellales bacterium]
MPEVLTLGHPQLAEPSVPVDLEDITTTLFQERLVLLETGLNHHGANGIAAPQLGWFQRFFLMRDPSGSGALVYWINPQLTILDPAPVWYWEGCLSVPGLKAYVGRPRAIKVDGFDRYGRPLSREFADWEAHLYQHEHDHLDGILFPYRVADPRHMVTADELAQRDRWPDSWPVVGARDAPIRVVNPGD